MRTSTKSSGRLKYIENLFGEEDQALKDVRQALQRDGKEGINIGPSEGALLHTLVKLGRVKTAVEIGTLYGYSAIWMARALPDDGRLYCVEKSEENFKKAADLIGASEVADKISLIQGDAAEVLEDLAGKGPFDLVFIDANKGGYGKYLDWAEDNVRQGGLIVGDNTFLFGHVYGEGKTDSKMGPNPIQTMREFNLRLAQSDKYTSCLIPTDEGMTVAIKK